MSFELLSEPIRKYIRDKRWEQFRPIQTAAIEKIIGTEANYILASRTASGKTEAAFLPILSKVNFQDPGVQVLYISPLIALINDQFFRVEELCKYLDVVVTKWHGEAKRSEKENLIKKPEGIVLITPESLEAMFVNKPYNVKALFANLKYVVIDEIHSFIGSDRGIQLKSILSRLQRINNSSFKVVGLSATLGDFEEAKKFTGDAINTKVLVDKTAKEIDAHFRYFESAKEELPLELLKDLYLETKDNKALIFPNSRGRAEEVAVKLRKISDRVNGHKNYFSHHSSVDRELREYIEQFAKNNVRFNFCISCTSTLELGIDIGTVDEVIQIDAAHSIASLIQRVGRSGRRDGAKSNLLLYATNKWSILQSLACWLLYKEGFIEPPEQSDKPYDILAHQILSIVKGHSGIETDDLFKQLRENHAFTGIGDDEIRTIFDHLQAIDFLEKIRTEYIIGVEGEKIVNSRDFYSVFKTEEQFKVLNSGNVVGEIPISPQVIEDENILLAAQIWKIKFIDYDAKKIEVVKAVDGKSPMFFGSGGFIHKRIREKMFQVLFSKEDYAVLNQESKDALNELRREFSIFHINDLQSERPLYIHPKHLELYTFTGTKINRAICFLLKIAGIKNILEEQASFIELEVSIQEIINQRLLSEPISNIDQHLSNLLDENTALLDFSKWGVYLPRRMQIQLLKNKYFDFDGAEVLLTSLKLVSNK